MRLPQGRATTGPVLLGRALAACVHPVAAWRSRSRDFRLHVVAGYFIAGYVLTLIALVLGMSPAS
jgi:hypothetical protein